MGSLLNANEGIDRVDAGGRVAARVARAMALGLIAMVPWRGASGQAAARPDTTFDAAKAAAVVAGRQIFHGVGTCFACHGAKLEGTAIAPTLRAHKWRNGDGTLEAIIHIVTRGVPNTLMVSHPGGISDAQLKQVATYVWAVSSGKVPP